MIRYRKIIFIIYFLVSVFSFFYFNDIVQSIFDLKYLSVKSYLLMILFVNLIFLFTLNRNVMFLYKIINYILFSVITVIFGGFVAIVLGNRFTQLYIMDISKAVHLIDLSLVIFLIYLIVVSLIYIGYYIFLKKDEEVIKEEVIKEKVSFNKIKFPKLSFFKNLTNIKSKKKEQVQYVKKNEKVITLEDLFASFNEDGFYIDGVECGIIFEDSNQENILKNYYILSNDINARLMGFYTGV